MIQLIDDLTYVTPLSATVDVGSGVMGSDNMVPDTVPGAATITGATNVTNTVITTSGAHGFWVGMSVVIAGVLGNTAVNGTWPVTAVGSSTTFTIPAVGNGAYTSGGAATPLQLRAQWKSEEGGILIPFGPSVMASVQEVSSGGGNSCF